MLLELRKAFMSVSFVHHYCRPEALFITGGCHLTPGCYVLLLHISLNGLPANESPRKLVNKSTHYTDTDMEFVTGSKMSVRAWFF